MIEVVDKDGSRREMDTWLYWHHPGRGLGGRTEAGMYYVPLVVRKDSKAQQLADALLNERRNPATVYVVGMTDADALADALIEGQIEVEVEMTAEEALKYQFVEAIGTEDEFNNASGLLQRARERIKEIDRKGSTRR